MKKNSCEGLARETRENNEIFSNHENFERGPPKHAGGTVTGIKVSTLLGLILRICSGDEWCVRTRDFENGQGYP